MAQRYTQKEVGRILGLQTNRLRYWERLRLVRPQSRWGERFYNFGDLVALRNIQRLTQNRIPARRLQRAVHLVEQQFGHSPLPLQQLRILDHGGEVVIIPPDGRTPFNPIRNQWVFSFEASPETPKLQQMADLTAEQLFEQALDCEAREGALPQAAEAYRRVLETSPNWIDAHINLGVALYQMGKIDEARTEFHSAVQLDPSNGISSYNLGCVLEEQGEILEAIEHLRRAAQAMPRHADVHFNLAIAHEKIGDLRQARENWKSYLRCAPNGVWADHARSRLKQPSRNRKPAPPIPFRRPS